MHAVSRDPRLMPTVSLVVAPGPSLAPTLDLLRALWSERQIAVRALYIVVGRSGLESLHTELLDSGAGLDRLAAELGEGGLDHDGVHTYLTRLPSGEVLDDELEPAHAACFREVLWSATRDALAGSGARPVYFALLDGMRSSSSAQLGAFCQLLARAQDRLISLRPPSDLVGAQRILEHELPHLHGVLDGTVLTTFESAVQVARARAGTAPPMLRIDLAQGFVEVDGTEVDLSPAERLWYAYLAWRRSETVDGWVLAGRDGHEDFLAFLRRVGARRRTSSIRSRPLRELLEAQSVHDDDLRNLRGKTVQRWKRWCARHRPELAALLVPEADGLGHQRIPLSAARIELAGLPRGASLP